MNDPSFQPWLRQVVDRPTKAFCNACKIVGAEITSLRRHRETKLHVNNLGKLVSEPPVECKVSAIVRTSTAHPAMILLACLFAEHNLTFQLADHPNENYQSRFGNRLGSVHEDEMRRGD